MAEYLNGQLRLSLDVRVTSGKAPEPARAAKKAPQTRRAGVAASRTGVRAAAGAPTPAATKKRIRDFVHDEDGDRDQDRSDAYVNDSFVVGDDCSDEASADDFETVKPAPKARRRLSKAKPLGQPITVDERVADLDEDEKDLLENFVSEGKQIAKAIQLRRGLSRQPFSDTVIREMGLRLPTTEAEFLQIPTIKPDMVKLYSKKYSGLISNMKEVKGHQNPVSRRRRLPDEDEVTYDPNHQVIDLLSDDSDSDYGSDPNFESEAERVQTSGYFEQQRLGADYTEPEPPSPPAQTRTRARTSASRPPTTSTSGKPSKRRNPAGGGGGGDTQGHRKSSGGFYKRKRFGGAYKRGGGKKSGGRAESSSHGRARQAPATGGRGTAGTRGIAAMPT